MSALLLAAAAVLIVGAGIACLEADVLRRWGCPSPARQARSLALWFLTSGVISGVAGLLLPGGAA